MKSLYSFIIKPLKSRYNNEIEVNDKKLILNSNIEIFQSVEKRAVVVSIPAAIKTDIKIGDILYVHHNIFRQYYGVRGEVRNSSSYFKDDLFFCEPHQIYLYTSHDELKCNLDYCFVSPIENKDILSVEKEKPLLGVVKYGNKSLEALGINPGDFITFTPNSEFEFVVEDDLLYCMKSKDIALKHEYEGNEKKYNPSWAKSS